MQSSIKKYQLEKLGNTLIYLANNVGDFGKTKALKLLFLLEEMSIKELGVPFFGFDYKVWQYGPVIEPVYYDLDKKDTPLLSAFIKRASYNPDEFEAVAEFNDDEFSNNDIYLLDKVVQFARHKTAKDLVNFTHAEGSLWKTTADAFNLTSQFNNKTLAISDIVIDFSSLLDKDSFIYERYQSALDYNKFINLVKS